MDKKKLSEQNLPNPKKKEHDKLRCFREPRKTMSTKLDCYNFEFYEHKEKIEKAVPIDSKKIKKLNNLEEPKKEHTKNESTKKKIGLDPIHKEELPKKRASSKALNYLVYEKKTNDDNKYKNLAPDMFKSKQLPRAGFYTEDNPKFRNYMEDVALIVEHINKDPSKFLYCIFDGHGGRNSADICKEKFPEILCKNLTHNPIDIDLVLTKTYEDVEHELEIELLKVGLNNVGNTATTVLIVDKFLYCANVGDSSCILIYEKGNNFKFEKNTECSKSLTEFKDFTQNVTQISYDHKCTDEAEVKRIEKSKGFIMENRVGGVIAVSRAFGDLSVRNEGLISTPYIYKTHIHNNLLFCILASDGVWDVLSKDNVYNICIDNINKDENEISECIVKNALENGSEDNISCIVIRLSDGSGKRRKSFMK